MSEIDAICKKVSTIDQEAAKYIRCRYEDDILSMDKSEVRDRPSIISCLFVWSSTPQGHTYWHDIYIEYSHLHSLTKKGNMP